MCVFPPTVSASPYLLLARESEETDVQKQGGHFREGHVLGSKAHQCNLAYKSVFKGHCWGCAQRNKQEHQRQTTPEGEKGNFLAEANQKRGRVVQWLEHLNQEALSSNSHLSLTLLE